MTHGRLVVITSDDGYTDERPCSEEELRAAIAELPDGFRKIVQWWRAQRAIADADATLRTNAPVDVRDATAADADAIARVHLASSEDAYAPLAIHWPTPDHAARAAFWAEVLATPRDDRVELVARVDDEIVGFISGGPRRDNDVDAELEILRRARAAGPPRTWHRRGAVASGLRTAARARAALDVARDLRRARLLSSASRCLRHYPPPCVAVPRGTDPDRRRDRR